MSIRCCIFVDGENLRHSICDLFHGIFSAADYLPKLADWAPLYDWLVYETVGAGGNRVRTYWYVVEQMDFFPYRPFPRDKDTQRKMLSRHAPYKTELDSLAGPARDTRIDGMLEELTNRHRTMRDRFDGWRKVQDGISLKHDAIEFRRAGAIRYNLFDRSLGDEKAVDVKLATDLIVLKDVYDVAVIVSGDQDYVPAVQVLKDRGKRVINVAFQTRNGRLLPGGAKRLNHVTDKAFEVPYADMKSHLKL